MLLHFLSLFLIWLFNLGNEYISLIILKAYYQHQPIRQLELIIYFIIKIGTGHSCGGLKERKEKKASLADNLFSSVHEMPLVLLGLVSPLLELHQWPLNSWSRHIPLQGIWKLNAQGIRGRWSSPVLNFPVYY